MAIDYTIGFTEEEILEILTIQKAELKKDIAVVFGFGEFGYKTKVR